MARAFFTQIDPHPVADACGYGGHQKVEQGLGQVFMQMRAVTAHGGLQCLGVEPDSREGCAEAQFRREELAVVANRFRLCECHVDTGGAQAPAFQPGHDAPDQSQKQHVGEIAGLDLSGEEVQFDPYVPTVVQQHRVKVVLQEPQGVGEFPQGAEQSVAGQG
ncbi:hypothetical protein D3C81_1214210 [compost metagenome]